MLMLEQTDSMPSFHPILPKHHGKKVSLPLSTHFLADKTVVHASEIPYVWGASTKPSINEPLDLALSRQIQKGWISFASFLDPNTLGDLSPGVGWPSYQENSQNVMVFQKPDGSGEQGNGAPGTPVGQGLHVEHDFDDRPVCDYYAANDAAFVH
jgi:hypothetical protein